LRALAALVRIMAALPASGSRAAPRPAISAHRGGSESGPPGTYDAYRTALAAGADYLEFDVRRTADDHLVAFHDPDVGRGRPVGSLTYADICRLTGYEVPTVSGVLRLLADSAGAHIDLKEPDCLEAIVTEALTILEPMRILVTTGDEAAISELRRRFPLVPAGLTIGGNLGQTMRHLAGRARGRVRSRADAVARVQADWAIVQERLARAGVLAECRRRGLRTMIWTVNDDRALSRWLSSPDVDVIVTDRPRRAAELRRLL
jgi:glycerophosphoryl diester phosphodiesterase